MRLRPDELQQVDRILERIDAGEMRPRLSGRVGRFLRQYGTARLRLRELLLEHGVRTREDGAVSGRDVGPIELHPLTPPDVRTRPYPLGEVAQAMAVSDELGALVSLVLWLKGPVANAAYNMLRSDLSGMQLKGDYRWTPACRLTPGESSIRGAVKAVAWGDARCLKAVSDDLGRPPHALEYVLDHRMGPPGLKYFRTLCVRTHAEEWEVLPGLKEPRRIELSIPPAMASAVDLAGRGLAQVLAYREPWSLVWTVVDAAEIGPDEALAHSITWADVRLELEMSELGGATVAGLERALRGSGLRPAGLGTPNLTRSLLPVPRIVHSWLRGYA